MTMKFSENDLKKYRDASYMKSCNIKAKEFFETHDTIRKSLSDIRKYYGVQRLDMIHDFCSGHTFNALYLIARNQSKYVTVVDKRFPKSADKIQTYYSRFMSRVITKEEDIFRIDYDILGKSLILSIHPCRNLSYRVVKIAIENNLPIVLVPCCIPKGHDSFINSFEHLSPFVRHELKLCDELSKNNYEIKIKKIREHITPRNTIIIGLPKGE